MNRQRQAGFIRNYSNKRLPELPQEPSEFSYFRPRPHREDTEEFSPYKIEPGETLQRQEAKRNVLVRPPLPVKSKEGGLVLGTSSQKEMRLQGQQVYSKLKEKMNAYEQRKEKSKEKLQENIGNIRNKIQQLDIALQELKNSKSTEQIRLQKKIQQQMQAELSSSSSQSEEVVVNSIPSPKLSIEKPQRRQILRNKEVEVEQEEHDRQSHERGNSYSQRQNIITFNSRTSNRPPLQIRDYSSSDEQEESRPAQQQRRQEESEKQQEEYLAQKKTQVEMRPILHQQATVHRQNRGVFKNKGGVCFDIDTRQFTAPIPQPKDDPKPKKAPKVDKRSEVIRRRQTAKAYDKMARKALFTAYH